VAIGSILVDNAIKADAVHGFDREAARYWVLDAALKLGIESEDAM
jgi:hypothetical protein